VERIGIRICNKETRIGSKLSAKMQNDIRKQIATLQSRLTLVKNRWVAFFAKKYNIAEAASEVQLFPKNIHDIYNDNCNALRDSLQKYGVDNYPDLMMKIYEPLVKKYKIKSYDELLVFIAKYKAQRSQQASEKIKAESDKKFLNKNLNLDAVAYYMTNTQRLGWYNCDHPVDKREQKSIVVFNEATENTTAYFVDPQLKVLIPISVSGKDFKMKIPGNKAFKIVVIKVIQGALYMGVSSLGQKEKEIRVAVHKKTHEQFLELINRLSRGFD